MPGSLHEVSMRERVRIRKVETLSDDLEAFMSPGSVTEKLHFFVAEYDGSSKVTHGGGNRTEGEDIEVIELPINDAIKAIENGAIEDGKTIMLLQYAGMHLFKQADAHV